jgi:hypothetical protein
MVLGKYVDYFPRQTVLGVETVRLSKAYNPNLEAFLESFPLTL